MICLDTSAYSNFMRGQRQAVATVLGASDIVLPTIVVGELRYGFRRGSRFEKNETRFHPQRLRRWAQRFSPSRFDEAFDREIEAALDGSLP